ncbi:MAG: hypothetical protein ACOH2K_03845 [Burkholderiaceae bacterium]
MNATAKVNGLDIVGMYLLPLTWTGMAQRLCSVSWQEKQHCQTKETKTYKYLR